MGMEWRFRVWRFSACVGVASLLLAVMVARAAPGADPLTDYLGGLSSDQQARVAAVIKAAGTHEQERQAALQEALVTLNPDLGRALDLLNADEPANALPILEKLSRAPDPYLTTHVAWFRVRALVAGERFEDALAVLTAVQTNAARYSLLSGDMMYTEGVLHACLLDRPAARKTLEGYLKQYPESAPERRDSAQEVLRDVRYVDPQSLSEVALQMNDSRRRLQLEDYSAGTLARQAAIVELFDKAIEKAELQVAGGGKASKGTGQGGKQQKGKSGEKPSKGAKESILSDGKGGKVDLAEPSAGSAPDDWAKAYARERETVQRELQSRVPDRYRDLIEQYYRSLSEGGETETRADE
jgi:tetratricopeptide (TPR) repeat protein